MSATATLPKVTQLEGTRQVTLDGKPRTLKQLAADVEARTGRTATEASISARLRDLRKPPYNLTVDRVSDGAGGFLYTVRSSVPTPNRPILYGHSHTPTGPQPNAPRPVAGSRSANAYADTLR